MNSKTAMGIVKRTLSLHLEKNVSDFEKLYELGVGSELPEYLIEYEDLFDDCFVELIEDLGEA